MRTLNAARGRRFGKNKNRKGIALITAYLAVAVITITSASTFERTLAEWRNVEREISRVRTYAAAEAGVQNAMAQVGLNAFTGFINTTPINVANFQSVSGVPVGNYAVAINYPNQADWVIVQSTATVGTETRTLEGRIFLDSNFSKYLVYAQTNNFGSGGGAQYGEPDATDANGDGVRDNPEWVPASEDDRASMYFTDTWTMSGPNVQTYGDANAERRINGNASSQVHGDTYTGQFRQGPQGDVLATGVSGGLRTGDGFADDTDRNRDGVIDNRDAPDNHALTPDGAGDAHAQERLVAINPAFYQANNSVPAFGGPAARERFLEFVPNGASTLVREYNAGYAAPVASYNLPASAIVYVNGNTHVRGEMQGRVSVVSTQSIYFDGNVAYTGNQKRADANHSTAFMAKEKMYFRKNDLEVSGILYGENTRSTPVVFDASQNTAGRIDPTSKQRLRLYGNRIMVGSTNLSNYRDRVYAYDQNLKYFRPPGIPVQPVLRTVRDS